MRSAPGYTITVYDMCRIALQRLLVVLWSCTGRVFRLVADSLAALFVTTRAAARAVIACCLLPNAADDVNYASQQDCRYYDILNGHGVCEV